jgi:hypothetical protein
VVVFVVAVAVVTVVVVRVVVVAVVFGRANVHGNFNPVVAVNTIGCF